MADTTITNIGIRENVLKHKGELYYFAENIGIEHTFFEEMKEIVNVTAVPEAFVSIGEILPTDESSLDNLDVDMKRERAWFDTVIPENVKTIQRLLRKHPGTKYIKWRSLLQPAKILLINYIDTHNQNRTKAFKFEHFTDPEYYSRLRKHFPDIVSNLKNPLYLMTSRFNRQFVDHNLLGLGRRRILLESPWDEDDSNRIIVNVIIGLLAPGENSTSLRYLSEIIEQPGQSFLFSGPYRIHMRS